MANPTPCPSSPGCDPGDQQGLLGEESRARKGMATPWGLGGWGGVGELQNTHFRTGVGFIISSSGINPKFLSLLLRSRWMIYPHPRTCGDPTVQDTANK